MRYVRYVRNVAGYKQQYNACIDPTAVLLRKLILPSCVFYCIILTFVFCVYLFADTVDGDDDGDNTMSQYAILAISLLVTTVVGYVNFMNPAQRWQQLRGIE